MAQLSIKLSDKAMALIAQLQKEIFNRRRKKVTTTGVVETLIESGAKSQSDRRFAASWQNLVADIEKAAKVADSYGNKPASLSNEEWALVLSHRTRPQRSSTPSKTVAKSASKTTVARKPAPAKKAAVRSKRPSTPAAVDVATSAS
jgi:topoisomerase IA-like protein